MKFRLIPFLATAAVSLQAHPGHAPFSEGAEHFLSSPTHLLPALCVSIALVLAAQLLKQPLQRAAVRTLAALIAVIASLS